MKQFFFLAFLLYNTAQAQVDTIRYVKRTEKFYLNDKKLQYRDMKPMLLEFNSSALEFKRYQRLATPGSIILLVGIVSGINAPRRPGQE